MNAKINGWLETPIGWLTLWFRWPPRGKDPPEPPVPLIL